MGMDIFPDGVDGIFQAFFNLEADQGFSTGEFQATELEVFECQAGEFMFGQVGR